MKQLLGILFLSVGIMTAGSAQQSTNLRKREFNLESSGLAIQGYDPVAYFNQSKAIEGKKDITTQYNGINYRFANMQNRDAFTAAPEKYEPQYGGWCAYAMGAKGEKVAVDPETFKIVDGKLYLFYNKFFNNTLKDWNKDEAHLKANADKSWQKLVQQ
jgi:YHS domain-containing protein